MRWWPPLPSAMNRRRSPTRTSSNPSPRTSLRRSAPSSIACTMARSRAVRNAARNVSTSVGLSTRGRVRGVRINGTPRLRRVECRVANPRGTGLTPMPLSPRAMR